MKVACSIRMRPRPDMFGWPEAQATVGEMDTWINDTMVRDWMGRTDAKGKPTPCLYTLTLKPPNLRR
jgi:hypothetical protein